MPRAWAERAPCCESAGPETDDGATTELTCRGTHASGDPCVGRAREADGMATGGAMGARGEQPVAREGASVSPERAPQSRRGPGCAATVGESVGCVVQGPAHASQGAHRTATASRLTVGDSDRPVGAQSDH